MNSENPTDALKRYLQDAVAAEKNFETQLETCAKQGDEPEVQALFREHAEETRRQHERLSARLRAIGGEESSMKGFFASLLGSMPKAPQMGHPESEKSTQNLIMNFAVENSEIAMYEALASVAEMAGDYETERLAREIQEEERITAERIWKLLPRSARHALGRTTQAQPGL